MQGHAHPVFRLDAKNGWAKTGAAGLWQTARPGTDRAVAGAA